MGRPSKQTFIANTGVATASATITGTQASPTQIIQGWPVGDNLLEGLNIRLSGNMSITSGPSGALNNLGGLQFLRNMIFSTDKHQNIIDGLDGILLYRIASVYSRNKPLATDVSSANTGSPTFEYHLRLPFIDERAVRPRDTAIDMLNVTACKLYTLFGVNTDFMALGANTSANTVVQVYNQEVSAQVYPGPVDRSKDRPLLMPYWGTYSYAVSGTAKRQQVQLSYGDRIIKKLFVTQRNSSSLIELNNTIIGVNDLDRVSLAVDNFLWLDNISWLELQGRTNELYGIASQTGVAVIDFEQLLWGTGVKHTDALDLLKPNGTIYFYGDVTTGTNYSLNFGYEALKPIPPAADTTPASNAPAAGGK